MKEEVFNKLKQEWIQQRNSDMFNLEWFYRYFLEKGGTPINPNQFGQLIQMYLGQNRDVIFKQIDREFGLTMLLDKNKKFIKVVV